MVHGYASYQVLHATGIEQEKLLKDFQLLMNYLYYLSKGINYISVEHSLKYCQDLEYSGAVCCRLTQQTLLDLLAVQRLHTTGTSLL